MQHAGIKSLYKNGVYVPFSVRLPYMDQGRSGQISITKVHSPTLLALREGVLIPEKYDRPICSA